MGVVLLKQGRASHRVLIIRTTCLMLALIPILSWHEWRLIIPNPLPGQTTPAIGVRAYDVMTEANSEIFPASIFLVVWLVVAMIGCANLLKGWISLSIIWSKAQPIDVATNAQIALACKSLRVHGVVNARIAPVPSPMVFGIPSKMLLPTLFQTWSRQEQNAALNHEIAHVQARDIMWNMVLQIMRIAFWWNPFIHWITNEHQLNIELAADERVLRAGFCQVSYAESLVKIAHNSAPRIGEALTCSFVAVNSLERRVRAAIRFDGKINSTLSILSIVLVSLPIMSGIIAVGERASVPVNQTLGERLAIQRNVIKSQANPQNLSLPKEGTKSKLSQKWKINPVKGAKSLDQKSPALRKRKASNSVNRNPKATIQDSSDPFRPNGPSTQETKLGSSDPFKSGPSSNSYEPTDPFGPSSNGL
jgi:beta-lactamase regulating signal transducer with metallopeptidase domain